jgi:hypothetical protein
MLRSTLVRVSDANVDAAPPQRSKVRRNALSLGSVICFSDWQAVYDRWIDNLLHKHCSNIVQIASRIFIDAIAELLVLPVTRKSAEPI